LGKPIWLSHGSKAKPCSHELREKLAQEQTQVYISDFSLGKATQGLAKNPSSPNNELTTNKL
jgi:hypothetical protein